MRRVRILLFFIIVLCLHIDTRGQVQDDQLIFKEYIQNILLYHPIAKIAELKNNSSEASLLAAKGGLDPKLTSGWDQKNFDDKLYYRQYQGKLKIPTIFGLDVVAGYKNMQGDFLNPENTTDDFGLWNVGVEADLLQGLIINPRKTQLEQAKVIQRLNSNERQLMLNELLLMASVAYLNWQQYYYTDEILTENFDLAQAYLKNTRQSFLNGEKTAMDTLEASILLQDAVIYQQNNNLLLIKSKQEVENYLWYDQQPVALLTQTKPEDYNNNLSQNVQLSLASNIDAHPLLLKKQNKLSFIETEQRLKREKLKPKLNLKFNPLLATNNSLAPSYAINDNTWGFDFSFPLFLRAERGAIQLGEIKINEIQLEIENKRNELTNKTEATLARIQLLENQISLLEQNVANYKTLLDGEQQKFDFGESSVFLLNKRQEKYIGGRIKLVKMTNMRKLEVLTFLFYTNQITDLI